MARSLGCEHTVLVLKQSEQELSQVISDSLGEMPDVTIECSGAEVSVRTAIYVSTILV